MLKKIFLFIVLITCSYCDLLDIAPVTDLGMPCPNNDCAKYELLGDSIETIIQVAVCRVNKILDDTSKLINEDVEKTLCELEKLIRNELDNNSNICTTEIDDAIQNLLDRIEIIVKDAIKLLDALIICVVRKITDLVAGNILGHIAVDPTHLVISNEILILYKKASNLIQTAKQELIDQLKNIIHTAICNNTVDSILNSWKGRTYEAVHSFEVDVREFVIKTVTTISGPATI